MRSAALRWPAVLSAAAFTLVLLATSEIGGTAAFLNASAAASPAAAVITSGTADLTVSALSLPATALYPGLTLYGAVTASNIGDVPLTLRVSGLTVLGTPTNDLSTALVVGIGAAGSTAACTAGTVAPGWSGSVTAQTAGPVGVILRAGAPQVLCVSVTLPLAAPATSQGQSAVNVGLRLTGIADQP
jgi:hypothetical protein